MTTQTSTRLDPFALRKGDLDLHFADAKIIQAVLVPTMLQWELEGGGFFVRRGTAKAMPDDLQQLRLPFHEPAQVALQQIPTRLHVTLSMSSLHERLERGVVDQTVGLSELRQATHRHPAVPAACLP